MRSDFQIILAQADFRKMEKLRPESWFSNDKTSQTIICSLKVGSIDP